MPMSEQCQGYKKGDYHAHTDSILSCFKAVMPHEFPGFMRAESNQRRKQAKQTAQW